MSDKPNAWNVTEREFLIARRMARDDIPAGDAEDLWQLCRFYRGQIFYRDHAERGLKLVRAYIKNNTAKFSGTT